MTALTLDDILLPLAITVIIDQKVREPEFNAFIRQGMGLAELFELDGVTPEGIRAWYDKNSDSLEKKLSTKRRNTLVLRALTRFKEDIHIENVYDAMVAISVSDKEYHIEESDLIKSAASIWGFQRPPLKVNTRKN